MIEPVLIAVRLAQYAGAAVLFGLPAFILYTQAHAFAPGLARRTRALLVAAAAMLVIASLGAIAAQSVFFAGSMELGLAQESLSAVAMQMGMGKAALVRAMAALAALVLLVVTPGLRVPVALLGGAAAVTLAWMGHAGAGEGAWGWALLASDVVHLLAASAWIGALAGFLMLLLLKPAQAKQQRGLHAALHRFSGVGSILVAALVVTGVFNGWMIIGPDGFATVLDSPYGRLLLLKLALFAAMLALAAANRFRLTPALAARLETGEPTAAAIGALRRSIALESAVGLLVLAVVAWLGTLSPAAG